MSDQPAMDPTSASTPPPDAGSKPPEDVAVTVSENPNVPPPPNAASSMHVGAAASAAVGGASKPEKIAAAKEHMRKNACTIWNEEKQIHTWRPVCGTRGSDLALYGVGTRLYFDFLFQMGILFLILAIVTGPTLYFNAMGGMLDESNPVYQFLGKLSIGNLGICPGGTCGSTEEVQNRMTYDGADMKLSEVTKYLGLLDGLAVVLFLAFGVYFHRIWIPRIVRQTDEKHITPADFAVQVIGLPARLKNGHEQYQAKLRSHFELLLKEELGIDDATAVQEVTLARNYNGAISKFMSEGSILSEIKEAEVKRDEAKAAGQEKQAAKTQKAIDKLQKQTEHINHALKKQGEMTDEERDVVSAFVLFNKEEYKDQMLHLYRFARSRSFRCCQARKLRFDNCRLRVDAACEPTDLYWENLDFGKWQRRARSCVTFILAVLILAVCIFCLVTSQSIQKVDVQVQPTRAWVIKTPPNSSSCLQVCEWQLFKSPYCYADLDNSADWKIARIFDARGSSEVTGNSTNLNLLGSSRASIVDGIDTCAQKWTSPACNGKGAARRDWIGIEFEEDKSVNENVRCMSLHQPQLAAAEKLEVYACPKDSLPAVGSDHKTWKPEKVCMPMQNVIPGKGKKMEKLYDASGYSVDSGSLAIHQDTSCSVPVTKEFAEKLIKRGADAAGDPTVSCYCKQQLSARGPEFQLPPYDTPEKELCQKWSEAESAKLGMMVGGVLAVLILNQVLFITFGYLVSWVRFCTVTELTKNQMVLLFVALFVNTGILVLLVNWAFLNELPVDFSHIFKGSYNDFDRSFFPNVGSSLCITIALQTVTNTSPQVAMSFVLTPLMAWWYQKGAVTQHKLDKIYQLPDWNISLRFAQVMNVIFCIMMYSGGMPVLYIVGFIYCFVGYWMDKWVLLRGSAKPPSYNETIVESALQMFPAAALLHTFITLLMFGQQNLFPSEWSQLTSIAESLFGMTRERSTVMVDKYQAGLATYSEYLNARVIDIAREGCVLLFLIFLVFAAFHLLSFLWRVLLKPFCFPLEAMVTESCRCCCRRKKSSLASQGETIAFDQARLDMSKNDVVNTYSISGNPRYLEASEALQYVGKHSHAEPAAPESAPPAGPAAESASHAEHHAESAV